MRTSMLASVRRREESGAAAIMVALSVVALCAVAAMVLDLGLARYDRQSNKAAADASATAGIWALDNGTGMSMSFRGVCEARAYVRANQPDLRRPGVTLSDTWRTGTGATISGNPCNQTSAQWSTACEPADKTTWAWYEGTALGGRIRVTIKSGYEVSDTYNGRPFAEEAVVTDGGNPLQGGCDQLAVIIEEREPPGFGTVVPGNSGLTTTVRTVGRVLVGSDGFAPVALLLLERNGCLAVEVASSNARVLVKGNGEHPGRIHSDSLGDASCSTGQHIIDSSWSDGVRAAKAVSGSLPGSITVRALLEGTAAAQAKAFDSPPAVVAEGAFESKPTGGKLVTRRPVDLRYRYPVRNEMASAPTRWNTVPTNGSTDADGNVVRVASGSECTTLSAAAMGHTGTLFFDCPSGLAYSASVTLNARTVIVNGPVAVKSGTTFALPAATKVYIKGSAAYGLSVSGTWEMNRTGQATCPSYNHPSRARVVIGQGELTASNSNAIIRMCHTAVLLMGDGTTGCVPSTAGTAPTSTGCTSANVNITGGTLDWTGPDAEATTSTLAAWAEFEDLALWTESSATNRIGGNGAMNMAGVFFLPNANPFELKGSGTQTVENAQYVARRLSLGGTGTMEMRPDPYDAVSIPFMAGFSLVR